jgi:hypothetical protein
VKVWLRLEGLLVLLLAAYAYRDLGGSWVLFGALFFVPDVSFAGYLAGPRAGAAVYNAAHSYAGPLLCALALFLAAATARLPLVLIWAAHVGFDRALGYGLKYPTAFQDTHLGRIGRGGPG